MYKATVRNQLNNPVFHDSLDIWNSYTGSGHTSAISWDAEQLDRPRRITTGARMEVSASTGSDVTGIYQDILVEVGDFFSFEAWARVESLTGSPAMQVRVAFLDINDAILMEHTSSTLSTIVDDVTLLFVEGLVAPASTITARCFLDATTSASGDTVIGYFSSTRAGKNSSFLAWNERAIAGAHAARGDTGRAALDIYEHFTTTLNSTTRAIILANT